MKMQIGKFATICHSSLDDSKQDIRLFKLLLTIINGRLRKYSLHKFRAVKTGDYAHIMRDGKPYYGTVWNDIEKKILLQNMIDGKVTNILAVIIDAK